MLASCKSVCPILLATVLVLSLAGCAMHPTPISSASPTVTNSATATPSPSTTPIPTDTSAPTPTITPPQYTLSDDQFACIGIGTIPGSLYDLTEIPKPTHLWVNLQDFYLPDGRTVHLEYSETVNPDTGEGHSFVSSITVYGQAPVVAVPDSTPIDDGTLVFRGFSLPVGFEVALADLLAACGTPDANSTVKGKAYIDDVWVKTLEYPGITIALNQLLKPSDTSKWTVLRVTLTNSTLKTPRGLIVGMPVGDAVRLFGTGAFEMVLVMNGSSVAGVHAMALQGPYEYSVSWFLTVVDGRITSIETQHFYYDA